MSAPDPSVDHPRGFALLAEVLLLGVLVGLAALPLVTVLGAVAAGCVALRDYLDEGRVPTLRRYARLLGAALRDPIALLAPLGLFAIAAVDALALLAGLPGGRLIGPAVGLALTGLAVVGLRGAAGWRPGTPWSVALRAGLARTRRDRAGTVTLATGLLVAVLVGSRVPVLLLILPGFMVLAAVAVAGRPPRHRTKLRE